MSIIGWIILGLIAGYIASKIVDRTGEGFVVDILLGIDGAVVGGWLFHGFGMRGVNGVNPYSFFCHDRAIVVLVAYHALFPRLSPCCQELLDSAVTPERGGLMSDRVSRVLMRWTSTHEARTPRLQRSALRGRCTDPSGRRKPWAWPLAIRTTGPRGGRTPNRRC